MGKRALHTAHLLFVLAVLSLLTAGCGPPCSDVTLYMINPDSSDGHVVDIKGDAEPWGPFWLPNRRRIGFFGCYSVRPDGSDLREAKSAGTTLVAGIRVSMDCRNTGSTLSPDGRERVVKAGGPGSISDIYVVRVSDGKRIRRLTTSGRVIDVSWGPGTSILYVQDNGDSTQMKCGD